METTYKTTKWGEVTESFLMKRKRQASTCKMVGTVALVLLFLTAIDAVLIFLTSRGIIPLALDLTLLTIVLVFLGGVALCAALIWLLMYFVFGVPATKKALAEARTQEIQRRKAQKEREEEDFQEAPPSVKKVEMQEPQYEEEPEIEEPVQYEEPPLQYEEPVEEEPVPYEEETPTYDDIPEEPQEPEEEQPVYEEEMPTEEPTANAREAFIPFTAPEETPLPEGTLEQYLASVSEAIRNHVIQMQEKIDALTAENEELKEVLKIASKDGVNAEVEEKLRDLDLAEEVNDSGAIELLPPVDIVTLNANVKIPVYEA